MLKPSIVCLINYVHGWFLVSKFVWVFTSLYTSKYLTFENNQNICRIKNIWGSNSINLYLSILQLVQF